MNLPAPLDARFRQLLGSLFSQLAARCLPAGGLTLPPRLAPPPPDTEKAGRCPYLRCAAQPPCTTLKRRGHGEQSKANPSQIPGRFSNASRIRIFAWSRVGQWRGADKRSRGTIRRREAAVRHSSRVTHTSPCMPREDTHVPRLPPPEPERVTGHDDTGHDDTGHGTDHGDTGG